MREIPECCKYFAKDLTCREVAQCNHIATEHCQELGTQNVFAETLMFRSLGILQAKQNGSTHVLGRTEQLPGEDFGITFSDLGTQFLSNAILLNSTSVVL